MASSSPTKIAGKIGGSRIVILTEDNSYVERAKD